MKKIIALILSLCLLCGAMAFADDQTISSTGNKEAKTTLQLEVGESYTVVIPATVEIPFNATRTDLPVEVTALCTYPTGTTPNTIRKLYVKVSNNDDTLDNEYGDTISYTIGGSESDSGKYLYFTEIGTKNFTVDIAKDKWDAAPAGSYTNTITFAVAIADFSN